MPLIYRILCEHCKEVCNVAVRESNIGQGISLDGVYESGETNTSFMCPTCELYNERTGSIQALVKAKMMFLVRFQRE